MLIWNLMTAGGWLMWPILICSLAATTIIVERLWTLRRRKVLPPKLLIALQGWAHQGRVGTVNLDDIAKASPLGRLVVEAIQSRHLDRDQIKTRVEDQGRVVTHQMERFLNTLGSIASVTPLLGLLGTVFGMIEVFTVISSEGTGNAEILAGGIGQALVTTAAGLTVAVPSLLFYRYLQGRVDELVLEMEQHVIHLTDLLADAHGQDNT